MAAADNGKVQGYVRRRLEKKWYIHLLQAAYQGKAVETKTVILSLSLNVSRALSEKSSQAASRTWLKHPRHLRRILALMSRSGGFYGQRACLWRERTLAAGS